MSSLACCTSRHPPSPEGVAPRPALASPPAFKLNAKSQGFFPASWSSESRLSKPEDAAAIEAIFEEDKSSLRDRHNKIVSKKTSSTLTAAKSRLKKHLSKDSGFTAPKRHSRVSVGTSEEEVERRAELRRIRQKRIQEELSQEGIYDDDAKSLSTIDGPVTHSTSAESFTGSSLGGQLIPPGPGRLKRASWPPRDPMPSLELEVPALPTPKSPLSKIELPLIPIFNQYVRPYHCFRFYPLICNRKGPMLEALYHGLMSPQTPTAKAQADAYFMEWSTTMVNSSATRSRRHSSPAISPQYEVEEPDVYQTTRKRSSIPPMPPAPIVGPQRLPSIADAGKSSWRLSFSSDNRGDQLRKLSQGVDIAALLHTNKLMDGRQPMRTWLHSQGLRATSQAIESFEDAPNLECLASHIQTSLSSANHGGVDGGGVDGGADSVAILHLHEMGISRRLASKGLQSSCSSPQLSSIGSRTHQRGVSGISGISRGTCKSRARRLQNTSDSLPLSERIPESWGNILENGNIQDGTSSFYPSANNSIQPSRTSSRFSLFSMRPGIKSKTELIGSNGKPASSSFHLSAMKSSSSEFLSPRNSLTPGSILIASASSESLPLQYTESHRRPTTDTNSTAISETESFRRRELELSVVRTRFAPAEASRSPSIPRLSKFREEFDSKLLFKAESVPSKPSTLSRLSKFAARSLDGPFERNLGIPEKVQHHRYLKHAKGPLSPVTSPLEDESVARIWGSAVYRNANPKAKEVASSLHIPIKKGRQDARLKSFHDTKKKNNASDASKEKKKFAQKGLGWTMGDTDWKKDSERADNPEDDWEAELGTIAQEPKGKSRNIVNNPTEPDRRYPAPWSKFSSHDRHERMSSADAKDRIQVKDYATDGSEFLDHGRKTLREELQERIVAQLDKQATAEVQNNTQGTFGRRSSMRPCGDLEFPELEVLPLSNASLLSHDEIAEHVEEVVKEEELDRREEELDAIFGPPMMRAARRLADPSGGITQETTVGNPGDRSALVKATGKGSRTGTSAVKTESKPSFSSLAKKGSAARRVPVARKPGEESLKPEPPPKISPATVMPARGLGDGNTLDLTDGSMDHGSEHSIVAQVDNSETDNGQISIGDPRFYDDCIVITTPGPETGLLCRNDHESLDDMSGKGSKKSKYRTWSGKDWDNVRHSAKNRRSLGTLKLRKSTDEILKELKKAEVVERDNALRAAEEAWGGC